MLRWLCKNNWEAFLFSASMFWNNYLVLDVLKNSMVKPLGSGAFAGNSFLLVRLTASFGPQILSLSFTFPWGNQRPFFSISPFNLQTCLSLNHLKHPYTHSLVPQNFPLPVKTCLASTHSQSYLLKLLLDSRLWGKREWAAVPAPLPPPNPGRNTNMQTKHCNSNGRNESAVPGCLSLTSHALPNFSAEYFYSNHQIQ